MGRSPRVGRVRPSFQVASVTHYANAARLHVRRTSERRRACVVSYANDQRGWSDLQNLDSLRFCSLPLTQTLCSLAERGFKRAPASEQP
jgi:hypothetical protein